jgi:hypothetical protein
MTVLAYMHHHCRRDAVVTSTETQKNEKKEEGKANKQYVCIHRTQNRKKSMSAVGTRWSGTRARPKALAYN